MFCDPEWPELGLGDMKAPDRPARIDDELKSYLESGASVVVGTRDEALIPEITRAWGPRVSEDRRSITVCVPLATSARTLDNLANNGRIALRCALPTTVKSVQLKGTCIDTTEPDAADLAAVEQHREVSLPGTSESEFRLLPKYFDFSCL